MVSFSSLCALVAISLLSFADCTVHYSEDFSGPWSSRWVHSAHPNNVGFPQNSYYDVSAGRWHSADEEADMGLHTSLDSHYYAASSKLPTLTRFDNFLAVQLSLKHEQLIECGGGFIKLLGATVDVQKFNGSSPYLVKFGQDNCGTDVRQVVVEIPLPDGRVAALKNSVRSLDDRLTHFYTLLLDFDAMELELRLDGEPAISEDGVRLKGSFADLLELTKKSPSGAVEKSAWQGESLLSQAVRYVGFELWQVKAGSVFDDLLLADSAKDTENSLKARFSHKRRQEERKMFEDEENFRQAEELRLRQEIEDLRQEQDRALQEYIQLKESQDADMPAPTTPFESARFYKQEEELVNQLALLSSHTHQLKLKKEKNLDKTKQPASDGLKHRKGAGKDEL